MKLKQNYMKQEVLGTDILIDTTGEFAGVIKLNKTMSEIVDGIIAGLGPDEIAQQICVKYAVDFGQALADVNEVCQRLADAGALE